MKIRPIVYIVPLVVLALAVGLGSSLLARIFVVLVVIGVVGLLWTFWGLRGLQMRVSEPPVHCSAGDSFKEEFTVTNESRIPKLLVKAEEQTTMPGYRDVSLVTLSPHGSQSWQSEVVCRRRGRYSLGSLRVTSGDLFGLFSRTGELGRPGEIVVFPRVVELPYFRTSFSTLVDFGHGAGGRRISQISPSASSVREMASGDSLEHIHWRSTAHAGKLMVKVFDAEHSSDNSKDVWIVLDMQQSAHFGNGDENTEEYSVMIAASMANRYLNDGMRVGLVASGDRYYYLPPDAGELHFGKMLDALALMKANGEEPVERVMGEVDGVGPNSTFVVVTPQSTEVVAEALRRLKNYGHSVVAVLTDSASFGGELDAAHISYGLGSLGVQVYTVKCGDDLAKALDSRTAMWYSRYL